MKWTDINDIAINLEEKYPSVNITTVRFTDLANWVMQLDDFDDEPKNCNEKILEAIQMAWLDERS